jgi:hypothetical protein
MILSLNDETHALLMKLSKVSGIPATKWVSMLLVSRRHRLEALIKGFELVQDQSAYLLETLSKALQEPPVEGSRPIQ